MPRLWKDTIDSHRQAVSGAILDTTWSLVRKHGLLSVTMSQIASEAGIGRATLYKYFPDVESILTAAHERHVNAHLARLQELRDQDGSAIRRLEMMLGAYAEICHFRARHGVQELGALLHRGEQAAHAEQRLLILFRDLLTEVAGAGELRDDVPADELALFCMHALSAAGDLDPGDAIGRLVELTLAALRPPAVPTKRSGGSAAL